MITSEEREQFINEIKDFKKLPDLWKVGNDVLYDMCKKYPNHNNHSEIIAKVWLIGRSYAVSLERKKKKEISGDNFYIQKVAPKFEKEFDNCLSGINELHELKEEDIPIVIETHKKVMDFIHKGITEDDRRSFVSKYLHFHFRELFFIYDSRASGEINEVWEKIKDVDGMKKIKSNLKIVNHDKVYADFFIKCFYLSNFCEENRINLDTRQIDSFLIQRANKKIEDKFAYNQQ